MGLDLERGVTRIIVTHLHPDHIGLARWLEGRSGAPVFMLENEIANARSVWDPSRGSEGFVRYMMRHGMDAETAGATAGTTRLGIRLPERLIPLQPEDRIEFGESKARVIHTPGHSDFHFVLHVEARRLLVAGDHLLLEITPNIGLWTYTAPRPLQRYLDSIDSLRGLEVDIVFPGHGPLFHDLDGRIEELIVHHEERLTVMHEALEDKPETAFEVSRRVFPDGLSDHQLRFALAETLAHLEHLVDDGRARRTGGDVVYYRAT
jgi:glyoxylase-like metal-dependent hydrolase (beta-lactamase superfamily II)